MFAKGFDHLPADPAGSRRAGGCLDDGQHGAVCRLGAAPLSPPGWVFPVVWTILYLLMGWASFLIWKSDAPQAAKKRTLGLYGVQLVVNFAWPLLFFRAGLYGFALIWLVILLVLVAETMLAFGRIDRRAAWLLAPYLLWLLFAAYLNAGVWLLNR